MHKGNRVFVIPGRKTYHLKDDDCPVSSSILKGKKKAQVITETEAKNQGFKMCVHCYKEYREDQRERPFGLVKSIFKLFR